MNFHVKLPAGYAAGLMPSVKLEDGWREGEEFFVKTADGWRTFWRREVVYINTQNLSGVSIYSLMGSPTKKRTYIFINRGVISGGALGFALQTGVFPSGSILKVINEASIVGAGGSGGPYAESAGSAGFPGGAALKLDMDITLDNSAGYIRGGGGGGGSGQWRSIKSGGVARSVYGGAGGVGAGPGAAAPGAPGNNQWGGDGGGGAGGIGGDYGVAGSSGGYGFGNTTYSTAGPWPGGAPGVAIVTGGNSLSFVAGNESDRVVGGVV